MAISGRMRFDQLSIRHPLMHAIRAQQFLSRWKAVQFDLIPALQGELGAMTPKLEQLIHVLEWVRLEEFVDATWIGIGRRLRSVPGLPTPLSPRPSWALGPRWG